MGQQAPHAPVARHTPSQHCCWPAHTAVQVELVRVPSQHVVQHVVSVARPRPPHGYGSSPLGPCGTTTGQLSAPNLDGEAWMLVMIGWLKPPCEMNASGFTVHSHQYSSIHASAVEHGPVEG